MELCEFNACVRTFKRKQQNDLSLCWHTAIFTNMAFAGKLKSLKYYLSDEEKITAPKLTKEEFEEKLKLFEGRLNDGS